MTRIRVSPRRGAADAAAVLGQQIKSARVARKWTAVKLANRSAWTAAPSPRSRLGLLGSHRQRLQRRRHLGSPPVSVPRTVPCSRVCVAKDETALALPAHSGGQASEAGGVGTMTSDPYRALRVFVWTWLPGESVACGGGGRRPRRCRPSGTSPMRGPTSTMRSAVSLYAP